MRWGLVILATALMACEQPANQGAGPTASTTTPNASAQSDLAATLPKPGEAASITLSSQIPHVYMTLQPDEGSGPISIVFAIDRSRDNSPENDPAIRLTPEDGKCNPQEMRRFDFPDATRQRPIFGPEESSRGISAKELPAFMAMMVTGEMMRQGLVVEPEASKPQNVCTRKLWERMVINQSAAQG